MKKLALTFIPLNPDLGLLLLRIAFSFTMITFHGWHKLTGWERELHTFPNYIGITSELSYILVVWFENFGAILIALGLLTRINAFGLVFTMAVAFIFHHHMNFTGPNAGEMAFTYGFAYLLLFLSGPGKYSLDYQWGIK